MSPLARQDVRLMTVDGVLAVAIGALITVGSRFAEHVRVSPHRPLDAIAYTLIGVSVLVLAVRRVWPLVALGGSVGAVTVYVALQYPYGPIFITLVVAAYTTATRLHIKRSAAACGVALLAVIAGHFLALGDFVVAAPRMASGAAWLVVAPWAIGTVVRLYREAGARSREEQARQRAYEERIRVAQEVHDVVGHGLSAINLQSGVALHVLEQHPEQARPALEAIRQTSKDALDELRGTLAVFRRPEGERAPSTGLAHLDTLVQRMNRAGLPVEATVTGDREQLSAAVDLAAYRIVQESLTNVLRHAGPARAMVRVEYLPAAVEIDIVDDGRARIADSTHTSGHGIVGMRERAAAVGGLLEAGPRPDGGFRVRAHLPFGGGRR